MCRDLALITGASSGIGRALAIEMLEHHHAEIIAVGRNREKLKSLQKEYPSRVQIVCADIADQVGRDKIVAAVLHSGKLLKYIVNNAGVIKPVKPLEDLRVDEYRYMMQANVEAPLFLTLALRSKMQTGGRVLFTSSGAAFRVEKGFEPYCISKTALETAFQCLKTYYVDDDVYFASVRPGMVDTGMSIYINQIDETVCPYAKIVKEKQMNQSILLPETAAQFMCWLLTQVDVQEFERHWNINDPDLLNWNRT